LGNYYYSSPLLKYTLSPLTDRLSENTLDNITPPLTGGTLPSPAFFVHNDLEGSLTFTTNTYATSVGISVVGYNIASANPSPSVSASLAVIVDGPSYTLVKGEPSSNTPPPLTTIASRGLRICSSAPSTYTYGGTTALPTLPISIAKYDQTQNIASGNYGGELQVVQGILCTKAFGNGYLKYQSYYYGTSALNTVDYSGIGTNGYRYSTFAWQLPVMTSPFKSFVFSFPNFTNLSVSPNISITDTTTQRNKIYIYYMFVDSSNQNSFNSGNSAILTSTWIDANTGGDPVLTPSGFNTTSTYSVFNALAGASYSGNTLTITPAIPQIKPITTTITLVLRVGLAMSSNATLTYANASYTA
jgi:hypothetical protein